MNELAEAGYSEREAGAMREEVVHYECSRGHEAERGGTYVIFLSGPSVNKITNWMRGSALINLVLGNIHIHSTVTTATGCETPFRVTGRGVEIGNRVAALCTVLTLARICRLPARLPIRAASWTPRPAKSVARVEASASVLIRTWGRTMASAMLC